MTTIFDTDDWLEVVDDEAGDAKEVRSKEAVVGEPRVC